MSMRNLFPGYYQPSEEEFFKIWQVCVFAFDANVLLNIYRYTHNTRERLFQILNNFQDRIWVPYQAAYEYQKERLNVISKQSKVDDEIRKILSDNLSKIEETLNKYSKYDSVKINQIKNEFKKTVEKANNILSNDNIKNDSLQFDNIRHKLDTILDKNIGRKYEKSELDKIYKQAEERFNNKIPPGYMDEKNKKSPEKYGDFVIWHQLIDYANSQNKPLIFVTDDGKEDWWWQHEGKTICTRPELVEEMFSEAGVFFHMYSSDKFINYAEKFLQIPQQQEIVKEVLDIRLQNEESQLVKMYTNRMTNLKKFKSNNYLEKDIAKLQFIRDQLTEGQRRSLLLAVRLAQPESDFIESALKLRKSKHNIIPYLSILLENELTVIDSLLQLVKFELEPVIMSKLLDTLLQEYGFKKE